MANFPRRAEFHELGRLGIGLIAFFMLMLFPPPANLVRALMGRRDEIAPLFVLIFFILILKQKGNSWETVQGLFVFILAAIQLIYKWQSAPYNGENLAGMLPWSDAAGYYSEALRLANGALMSTWGARRPLFASLLAVLIRLTGGNFMMILIILTLSNALAIYLAARSIKQFYGPMAAAFFLVFSLEFYSRFSGEVLTEQLGLPLANLALFSLLIGTRNRNLWRAILGLGLLTLALNARAGALFILPALALWLMFHFRQWANARRVIILAAAAIIAGFGINFALVRAVADPTGMPFSNYSYTLYGLASGNKGWLQVIKDHPNIQESEVMPLAIQKIRSEPLLFLHGMLDSIADYFRSDRGAYLFLFPGSENKNEIDLMLWGIVLAGLIFSIAKWRDALSGLELASFVGVVASLPLLPPIDSERMRTFAATIPFSALWIVTGVSVLSTWMRNLFVAREGEDYERTGVEAALEYLAWFLAASIVCLTMLAPLLLRLTTKHSQINLSLAYPPACTAPYEPIQGFGLRNATIILIRNTAAPESYMPFMRLGDFRGNMERIYASDPFLRKELLELKPGDRITLSLKLENGLPSSSMWIISKFPLRDGNFKACGRLTENEELQPYNFYYLDGSASPPTTLTVSQTYPAATRMIRLLYGGVAVVLIILLVMGLTGIDHHAWFDRKKRGL